MRSVSEAPYQKNNQGIAYKSSDKGSYSRRFALEGILVQYIDCDGFNRSCSHGNPNSRPLHFNKKASDDRGEHRYHKGDRVDVPHGRHNQNLNEKHYPYLLIMWFFVGDLWKLGFWYHPIAQKQPSKTSSNIPAYISKKNKANSGPYQCQKQFHITPPDFTTLNRGPLFKNLVNSSAFNGPRPLKTRGVLAGRNHVNRPTRKPIRGVTYPVAGHRAGRRAGLCPNWGSGAPTLTPTEGNSGAWGSLRLAAASCRSPLGQRLAVPLPRLGVH